MPTDVSAALNLRLNNGLSYAQIGKIQGVSKQSIHRCIKNLLPPPEIKLYQDHRADILSHLQVKLLANVDEARLKKASAYQLIGSMGLLYDKERIERGLSTANLSMLMADIEAVRGGAEDVSTGKLPE